MGSNQAQAQEQGQDSLVRELREAKRQALILGQLTGDRGPAPGVPTERRAAKNRRRENSFHAFLYGNFRPRRRSSRRADDHHRFIFDWHEPHVLYTALAIVLLSCTDALFTLNLLQIGAIEVNQIMDHLIQTSVERFLWIKIGTTIVSVLVLVFVAQRRILGQFRAIRILQGICVLYAGLIGYEIYLFSQILGMDPFTLGSLILFS
jgi:hypothetical protein